MLRPLHNVACLGIVAAFLAGCTVSDAEPQPAVGTAVGTAAAASPASPAPDTADDEAREDQASIDLGGWAMPEPGALDLETNLRNPFRPCKEIPDEVLSQLGVAKKPKNNTDILPYPCDLLPIKQDSFQGSLSITSEGTRASDLELAGFKRTGKIEGLREAWIVIDTQEEEQQSCFASVETPRGLINVHYINSFGLPSGESFCDRSVSILRGLYGEAA